MRAPDVVFRVAGEPPRRTAQAGRGAYAVGGRVRFYVRPEAREEEQRMAAEFRRQLPAGWEARRGAVRVAVELVYPATKKDALRGDELILHAVRPDVDNIVKGVLDALTRAGVWVDDGQVADLRVRKWRGNRPRWQVAVWFAVGGAEGAAADVADGLRRQGSAPL
jgi:Holliday junction resolvase RusA-like endonuclease